MIQQTYSYLQKLQLYITHDMMGVTGQLSVTGLLVSATGLT